MSDSNNSLVLSYLDLRKAVGIIGLCLPFALALGKIILDGSGVETSISAYYYTIMGDVFVGSLCAIAVFLMSYRGYDSTDANTAKLASVLAIGTALFPTTPAMNTTHLQSIIGNFHIAFATSLFITLSFFALVLFRKTDPAKPMTPEKQKRNLIYTICGYGMIGSIFLAFLLSFIPKTSHLFVYRPLFWLEALIIVFFGISWLVKGEAILKDEVSQ